MKFAIKDYFSTGVRKVASNTTKNEIFQETADLVKWKTSFYCAVRYQNDVV